MTEDPHISIRRTDKPYDGGDYVRLQPRRAPTARGVIVRLAVVIAIAFFASRFAEPRRCTEGVACPEPARELRPEVQP